MRKEQMRSSAKKLLTEEKLCYSIDETHRFFGGYITRSTSARANGRNKPCNESFNIQIQTTIIEDVLVLACEPIVRHSHGIHLTQLVRPGPPAAVNEPGKGKGGFLFVGFSRISGVRGLFPIVFWGIERGQAPKL